MSLWQISAYVKELRGFGPTEKAVLFVLAEYYNRLEKVAWPDQATLATAAGISERTLKRVLESLEAPRPGHPSGVLRRSRRHGGRGAVTNYHFVDFEDKGDNKDAKKEDTFGSVIRKNEQTKEFKKLPFPPLQGGISNLRPLTSRQIEKLRAKMEFLRAENREITNERVAPRPDCTACDGTGEKQNTAHGRMPCWCTFKQIEKPRLSTEQLLIEACKLLYFPLDSARAALIAAGVLEPNKESATATA